MHLLVMNILCTAVIYPSVLGIYFGKFHSEPENKYSDLDYNSEESQNDTLNLLNDSSVISNNVSEYPAVAQRSESTLDMLISETITSEKLNSISVSSSSVTNTPKIQSAGIEITVPEIFSNESNTTSSVTHSASPSSSIGQTNFSTKSISSVTSTGGAIIVSSTEDEEQEGVVRGKPSNTESTNATTSKTETIYQKALTLISDTYTLSILIPVAAGVVFASTILVTIATCKCLRRQCRRRRLRKKTLPDTVKHLRPSDRARLLAESSDEEF